MTDGLETDLQEEAPVEPAINDGVAEEALDKAIESTPGAVGLVDGVITHYSWYIPYIYGENWYEVDGTPLIDPVLLKSYK